MEKKVPVVLLLLIVVVLEAVEPNPPLWPSSVKVLDPANPVQSQLEIERAYVPNGGHRPPFDGQWSPYRFAFLLKPGVHDIEMSVGYYTSVMGLGSTPKDTEIRTVICKNGDYDYTGGALSNFWRSAENFYTQPRSEWNGHNDTMLWSVSQAAPLRRVIIDGNLDLFQVTSGDAGYGSGGYLADAIVTGTVSSGSQQQWLTRNSRVGFWADGSWNIAFVGCDGAPETSCGDAPPSFTTVDRTPVIAEKPYLVLDTVGRYHLAVPGVEWGKTGPTTDYETTERIDFSSVYVATDADDAAVINAKLAEGLHVVFSPGVYNLTDTIVVERSGTVLLGLGFATLVSTTGRPVLRVADVDGVRIAALLLQAGPVETATLLEWGTAGYAGRPEQPGVLQDCFARVGGTNDPYVEQMRAGTMVEINSGNTVIDNVWLWRADHGVGGQEVVDSMNPVNSALVVRGDNVTGYAVMCEHTLQNITEWYGDHGQVYFYQSELPYDVTQTNYGNLGFVSYYVAPNVTSHQAWAVGTYCNFQQAVVHVDSGISTPVGDDISFKNSLSVFLSGNGGISHVINNAGSSVSVQSDPQAYVCDYP